MAAWAAVAAKARRARLLIEASITEGGRVKEEKGEEKREKKKEEWRWVLINFLCVF